MAEIPYTACASTPDTITARPVVCRLNEGGHHPGPRSPPETPTDPASAHSLALLKHWLVLWHNTIGYSAPLPAAS